MKRAEIDLWIGRLVASEEQHRSLYDVLSEDEKRRADAFRFEKHRSSYVIGRGLLRSILATYLELDPNDISFTYGSHGKPFLRPLRVPTLQFNVAHAEACVLYALSRDCPLGVDVERVRELSDYDSLAKRFFASSESAEILSVDAVDRMKAFFNCWTRKEAFVKAVGKGLSIPLDSFEVSVRPGQPSKFKSLPTKSSAPPHWSLVHIEPGDGYVGALAFPMLHGSVRVWNFENANQCFEQLRYRSFP